MNLNGDFHNPAAVLNRNKATHLRGCIHWFAPGPALAFPVPFPALAFPVPVPVPALAFPAPCPVPAPSLVPFLSPSPAVVAPGHAPSPVPSPHWQQRPQQGGLGGLRTTITDITHTQDLYTHTTHRDGSGFLQKSDPYGLAVKS